MVILLFCHECGASRPTAKSLFIHYKAEHGYDSELAYSAVSDAIDFRNETNETIKEHRENNNKITFRPIAD